MTVDQARCNAAMSNVDCLTWGFCLIYEMIIKTRHKLMIQITMNIGIKIIADREIMGVFLLCVAILMFDLDNSKTSCGIFF